DPELFVRGTSGRYVSIARSQLGTIIYNALGGPVETMFGDSVRALDDDGTRVRVTFDSGTVRDFDLVIGADGQHSQVRKLLFGPEKQFEKFLGCRRGQRVSRARGPGRPDVHEGWIPSDKSLAS